MRQSRFQFDVVIEKRSILRRYPVTDLARVKTRVDPFYMERYMFKILARKLFGGSSSVESKHGFFLNVRCGACGEVFNLFINKSTDLIQNFDEKANLTYSLNKEIIGGTCRNLIHVKMEFDETKNLVSREIENGEFATMSN